MPSNLERIAFELAHTESLVKNMHTGNPESDLALLRIAARIRRIERMLRRQFETTSPDRGEIFDSEGYPR